MPELPANLIAKLEELAVQFDACEADLLSPEVITDHTKVRELSIRRASLEKVVGPFREWLGARSEAADTTAMLEGEQDEELRDLAKDELAVLNDRADTLAAQIQSRLVHAEDDAIGSVILEIRAGVGGDEAGLWARDLLDMYRRYADASGWTVEDLDLAAGDQGGVRSVTVSVEGESVWSCLGYEGGTHQVKRVPATESQGRVHTSTATVAVLPEPEEVEIDLDPGDVKEMITTATGPGGQNVNKVSTAVHLIHEPTGIEVRMQDTKSQAQNRQKAWKLLRARLFERQRAQQEAARAESRAAMIGSGSRAEKIRTYRYKDAIVVDHRIGRNFPLQPVLQGGLQPMVDELIELDTAQRLAAL
ncbi:MAG: PCRF domain-containing protein [Phycisphaerales bacterium]|jgi:peptide chain release factor 1|nr:PCRF domain-containing protein [Phycisphaerales bacterium]